MSAELIGLIASRPFPTPHDGRPVRRRQEEKSNGGHKREPGLTVCCRLSRGVKPRWPERPRMPTRTHSEHPFDKTAARQTTQERCVTRYVPLAGKGDDVKNRPLRSRRPRIFRCRNCPPREQARPASTSAIHANEPLGRLSEAPRSQGGAQSAAAVGARREPYAKSNQETSQPNTVCGKSRRVPPDGEDSRAARTPELGGAHGRDLAADRSRPWNQAIDMQSRRFQALCRLLTEGRRSRASCSAADIVISPDVQRTGNGNSAIAPLSTMCGGLSLGRN